jgi:hypothetical protein
MILPESREQQLRLKYPFDKARLHDGGSADAESNPRQSKSSKETSVQKEF